jgi:hypothetical protein
MYDNTKFIYVVISLLINTEMYWGQRQTQECCYRVELEEARRYNIQPDTERTTHFILYILYCILYLTFYF